MFYFLIRKLSIGNMVAENLSIENMVIGKKSRSAIKRINKGKFSDGMTIRKTNVMSQ